MKLMPRSATLVLILLQSTIYCTVYSVHQCRKNAIKETSLHQNCLQPKSMHRLYSLKALCAGSGPETWLTLFRSSNVRFFNFFLPIDIKSEPVPHWTNPVAYRIQIGFRPGRAFVKKIFFFSLFLLSKCWYKRDLSSRRTCSQMPNHFYWVLYCTVQCTLREVCTADRVSGRHKKRVAASKSLTGGLRTSKGHVSNACLWHACRTVSLGAILIITGIVLSVLGE